MSSDVMELDATFAALAHPVRRRIVMRLSLGEATVSELADPFEISMPAISRHLRVLEAAGLVERGRDGRERPTRLVGRPLREASEWIDRHREQWEGRLDRLAAHLADHDTKGTRP